MAATAFFLYCRFPGEVAAAYVEKVAARSRPAVFLKVARVLPALPLGIRLQDVRIGSRSRPSAPVFRATELAVGPDWFGLLKGGLGYAFVCEAYGGMLDGDLRFQEGPGEIVLAMEMSRVALGEIDLAGLLGRRLSGLLSGNLVFQGQGAAWPTGTGRADLVLAGGKIGLGRELFGLDSLAMEEIRGAAVLEKKSLAVELQFSGRELVGELGGTVLLKEDLLASSLSLRGTVEPTPDFMAKNRELGGIMEFFRTDKKDKEKFRLQIFGTLRQPRFKII